jgi:hypothetical protein
MSSALVKRLGWSMTSQVEVVGQVVGQVVVTCE